MTRQLGDDANAARENVELALVFEEHPEYGVLAFGKLRPKIPRTIANDQELKDYLAKRNNVFAKKYRPKVFFRIASMSYTWQVDLMVHKDRIFFVGIEVNSRFGFVEALKPRATGAASEWLPCLKRLIELKSPARKIICDAQFEKSHECKRMCARLHVKLYSFVARDMHKYHGNKLGFIDRFIRTLKWYYTKLNRPDMNIETCMKKLVDLYNNSPHSYLAKYVKTADTSNDATCKRGAIDKPPPLTPTDVIDDDRLLTEIFTDNMAYNHNLRDKLFGEFKVGDRVRHVLPRDPHVMRQKEDVMLSSEIYKITGVGNTGYYLTNERTDETLAKLYKPNELKAAVGDAASIRRRRAPTGTRAIDRELRDLRSPDHAARTRVPTPTPTQPMAQTQTRETRQHRVQKKTRASKAFKAQALIDVGTRLQTVWAVNRHLKWFWGTVKKVHPTIGRDNEGQILYVDIDWDDDTKSKYYRLYEDYYERADIESGWKL